MGGVDSPAGKEGGGCARIEGVASSGGKRRPANRTVRIFCNAEEYGGASAPNGVLELDASGCKTQEEVAAAVRRGFGLSSSRDVEIVTVKGETVTFDEVLAPEEGLRVVLRIDGALANFRMERVRSNLPVKGFLDDLAACQYTLLSALCELIDNSVQATRRNEAHTKRKIDITMNTVDDDPACRTLVISDNGEGFDAAASEEFATLGMRGEASRAGDTLGEGLSNAGTFKVYFSSILSRFGMGCKMAMNLIGDRYSLRSKTRGSLVILEASYDKFGDEYQYTERHVPCVPGEEDCSWSCITVAGLQEGTTEACFASHQDDWPLVLALNLRSLYFCHLELANDAGGRAGALQFADRMLRGLDKSVLAPTSSASGGSGSRKRKAGGGGGAAEGSAVGGNQRAGGGHYHEKAADCLKKTLHAFKTPQLKRKSTAVSLSLQVNGVDCMCKNSSVGKSVRDAAGKGAAEDKQLQHVAGGQAGLGECLWDYVLSDAGQDCFPLWFEVEEDGRKSVVMGAVLYFPIGEHSEEETIPRREVRVDMPRNSTESELRFTTLWMGRWLPGESFVPPFMTYDNHKRPSAPARAYRRAFGFMFLDRTFRPQQNKVAIEPNRSLWLSLRREMDNDKIFSAYDRWLLECNKRYDHEVLFDTERCHVVYDEDRGMTRHQSILLAGTRFKVGDKVKIARKGAKESAPACYSEIKNFWQDGHPTQARKDGYVSVVEMETLIFGDASEVKEIRFSQIAMTKITPTKWKEESIRLSKNLVVDIAWENNLLAARGAELEAGTVLRQQSVVCLNSEGKPVAGSPKGSGLPNLDVALVVSTPFAKSFDFTSEVRDSGARKDGTKRFEFGSLLDGDETIFSATGTYSFEFMLRRSKAKGEPPSEVVKTVTYSVAVLPGAPRVLELINREVSEDKCPVDMPLPILSFQILDAFQNPVRPDNNSIVGLELYFHPPGGGAKIPVDAMQYTVNGNVMNIHDVCIGKIQDRAPLGKWRLSIRASIAAGLPPRAVQPLSPGAHPCESVSQLMSPPKSPNGAVPAMAPEEGAKVNNRESESPDVLALEAAVKLHVIHGKPNKLSLCSIGTAQAGAGDAATMIMDNLTEMPKLQYFLHDCSGNVCTSFEGWVLILSPALQDRIQVPVARGVATVSQNAALQLRSPIFKKFMPPVPRAWGTQEAAALLGSGLHTGVSKAKRGKGGRGKKGQDAGTPLVAVDELQGFFLGETDFIIKGDFVLLNDAPAQVLELKQTPSSHQVLLRCLHSIGSDGPCASLEATAGVAGKRPREAGAGGTDGSSAVGSVAVRKKGTLTSPARGCALSSATNQSFTLEKGLFTSRSYVVPEKVVELNGMHAGRFLAPGVFVCANNTIDGLGQGIPSIAMDAFVVKGIDEPPRDVSDLSRRLCVHERTKLNLSSSKVPRSVDVVKTVDHGLRAVSSVLAGGISGKPGQLILGLMLELRDEAGCLCREDVNAEIRAAGEGGEEDMQTWEVSCSWAADPISELKHDVDGRVMLPQLPVPKTEPEIDCTAWVKVSDESILEANFKVQVETGPPAQLKLSLEGGGSGRAFDSPPQVQVGCDCAFRLSVLDERGAAIEGDCVMRQSTAVGAMRLRRLKMTVVDATGNEYPILVRQENFEKSTQSYVGDVRPQAELDDYGNFWLRCLRLQGLVGAIVLKVAALVETGNPLKNESGEAISKFLVNGDLAMMLCVGKPAAMVLRSHKIKRRGVANGGHGEATVSQAQEILIRCQSFVSNDPLVVCVVDESSNPVKDWKGKVLLDFKGSGTDRSAVVSSRKKDGLPAEEVLHFERGDASEMLLPGLTFKEAGKYSASLRSLGLPDIPVQFEVSAGNVVKSIELQMAHDVDLQSLPRGCRVSATVSLNTEDGAALESLDKTSISFYIEGCRELDVCTWRYEDGSLHVDLKMPTHTCTSDLFAVYSETRESFVPKPADIESNLVNVQILPGPLTNISLQVKQGQDSIIASQHELELPPMYIAALDDHGNKSFTLPSGESLQCDIVPEIECSTGELQLKNPQRFSLTAATNPVRITGLLIVRRDGAPIDFCEFAMNFKVEPASLSILALQRTFSHSNDEAVDGKIKGLREREKQLREQIEDSQREVQHAEQRMFDRTQQGFPVSDDDRKSHKEHLKKEVLEAKRKLMEGERNMAAEAARHDVDVAGLHGVIGVAADLGVIDRVEGCDARELRKCLSWNFRSKITSVLFQTQADLDAFDKLPREDTVTKRRIRRTYPAEMMLDLNKAKAPTFEGCIGYAHELVVVDDNLEAEDKQAARRLLNVVLSGLLVFEQYSHAVHFQKTMVLQKKRLPAALVGLDRPFDIIEIDGGRQNVLASSVARDCEKLPAFAILAFGSSSRGRAVRSKGEAAATKLREYEKQASEHRKDLEQVDLQNEALKSAEQELEQVLAELSTLTAHVRPPAARQKTGAGGSGSRKLTRVEEGGAKDRRSRRGKV